MSSAAVPAFARLIIKQSCNESGLSGEARFGCVSAGWLKVRLCNLSSTTVHQCSSCQCPIAGSQHVLSFECIQLAPPKNEKKGECPSIEAEAVTFLMLFNFSLDVFFSAVADMS